ncbi:MAG: hypothetical protein NTU44_17695 [Bacteroidetes bacterium]|nr:hypothetical protein [Bacteroidota bacterium]
MKKRNLLVVLIFLVVTTFHISCKRDNSSNTPIYGDKTLELISIVENNPTIKSMIIKSIEQAKVVNPDKNTNPAQTLDEYYQLALTDNVWFISRLV